MPRPQLVIFDFDGTLIDTAPDLISATNLFLRQEGLEPLPEARIREEIGMGLRNLILDLYPRDGNDPEREARIYAGFIAVYEREFLKSPRPFEGVREFLGDWNGRIAIVSNKRSKFIKPILEHLELHHFDWSAVIGGDTYANMKPHPEPFLAAMDAAGVTPEETLIVGDGLPDVQGAQAVGSRCVAVDFGYTPGEELMNHGAWRKMSSFTELLPLIETLK
jgi:phosphoglycolate phosphatase